MSKKLSDKTQVVSRLYYYLLYFNYVDNWEYMQKKFNKTKLISAIIATVLIVSCTNNERAKIYGGTTTIELPENQKLINITWKEQNMWYLTKPMNNNDSAETYIFHEESNYGVWEGTIIIKEVKTQSVSNISSKSYYWEEK